MESQPKEVIKSTYYFFDIQDIYEYGEETFGEKAARYFYEDLQLRVKSLSTHYFLHPECRHLETPNKIYRNIILGSYLIIYRITKDKIEVLRALHGSHSPEYIKSVRNISI